MDLIRELSIQKLKGSILSFFLLVLATLVFQYYVPAFFTAVYYLVLLYLYFQSKNEPFWLAFFLVVSNGFMGFLGKYSVTFGLISSLPEIELVQVYILFTIIKASRRPMKAKLFFSGLLRIFIVWIVFLIVEGYVLGISSSLNIQLRLIKTILPFALFYSIPRLFEDQGDYRQFFEYLFPVAIAALIAQAFTIIHGISLPVFFGVAELDLRELQIFGEKSDLIYRKIYSGRILLITLFAALFYLAKKNSDFSRFYLFVIIVCNYLAIYLSATRGWFICFSFAIGTSFLFAIRTKFRSIFLFAVFATGLFFFLRTIPAINNQITKASERLSTILSFASGDSEETKTLRRLRVRSPMVLKKWRESKLTGWGYSDTFYKYRDYHVANQNMLLHGGFIELFLFWLFILYFIFTLFDMYLRLENNSPYKRAILVPIFFLFGWLFMHSATDQHFSLHTHPVDAITQIVFFCFCNLIYNLSKESIRLEPVIDIKK